MSPTILIVGGGLSGLALAQCLRKRGINYKIFERDANDHARSQGWAILLRECLAGVYTLLPDDMPPLEQAASVFKNLDVEDRSKVQNFSGVHYATGEPIVNITSSNADDDISHHFMRVNRADFRTWLSHNLPIQWGKTFTHYEEDENGVTVHFDDGSSSKGDVLFAADGACSRTRRQLVGEDKAKSEMATVGCISANITMGEDEYLDLMKKGSAFFTATNPKYHFFMGPRGFNTPASTIDTKDSHDGDGKPKKTAEYYWSVTWDEGISTTTAKEWTRDAPASKQRQIALDICHDLHPSLRKFLENTIPEQIEFAGPQLMQWSPPSRSQDCIQSSGAQSNGTVADDSLGGHRVTLTGDALHTMVPFRGAGANTALLDAFDLVQLIEQAVAKGLDVKEVIRPYEKIAVPRGRGMVAFSKSVGMAPDPTHWSRVIEKLYGSGYVWERLPQIL